MVIDNNGKDVDSVKPVAEWAASQGAKQFLYVSSAGIYKPSVTPPHVEGDAVKSSASHVAVAITKMKKGISEKVQMSGDSELRLTQFLLDKLNNSILPTLEDTVRVSVSSAQRQRDTQPRRRVGMDADEIDNEDDE